MGNVKLICCILVLVASNLLMNGPGTAASAELLGKRIVLQNGMVLLLAEKHSIPMVTMNMTIMAGSISEPEEKPGLASLTASLLMQGTAKRTASQISREIDFIGGSLSVSGGDDFTSANLRVLRKDLMTGLDLLSDVLVNPVFDQKEIDRKVKESLAEIQRQKEEPNIIARQAFDKAVFGGHPYGKTNEDVAAYYPKLTRQDVVDYFAAKYGPSSTVIAVVGDVQEKEIVQMLNDYFKDWNAKAPSQIKTPQPPVRNKVSIQKIEKDITQANIVMGHLGISRSNPDYYAVMIMNYILGGGGFSARLMDNIRDNKGLAYDVHSGFSARKEPGAFSVSIQTKNESANEVIKETLKEVRRIQNQLVSEKELSDAKAYLTGSFPLKIDTYAKIAGMLTGIEIYDLGMDYPQKYPKLINAVTREEVQRVAKKYLHPDSMMIVVVANQDKAKIKDIPSESHK